MRRVWKRLVIALAGLGVVAGASLVGLVAGYEVRAREIFPNDLLAKVDRQLGQVLLSRIAEDPPIETTLLMLDRHDVAVSEGAGFNQKWGGGLTSFGDDVLLIRYTGTIFAASSADDLRETGLTGPANDREAYQADYRALSGDDDLGGPPSRGLDYLRYNDILHVARPDWSGLVVSYSDYDPARKCARNALAKLPIDPSVTSIDAVTAGPDDWEVFFRTEPCIGFKRKGVAFEGHMAGGRIALGPDGRVYLASGDHGIDGIRSDGAAFAQDPDAQYGKVIAVDPVTGADEIISIGLRNPQGIAVTANGDVFTVEHAMRGGDELNLHFKGANFGWPDVSYGTMYSKTPLPGKTEVGGHAGYDQAIFAWLPSIAVSGLAVVDGFHPAWQGDLLAAALKDASLYRIRLVGDRVVYSERIPIGARVRAVHQHTDGRIVLWTDSQELIFLEGRDLPNVLDQLDGYVASVGMSGDEAAAFKDAVAECARCHSLTPGASETAPELSKIYADAVASTSFPNYSHALKSLGGIWSADRLAAFISDPSGVAPGTTMPQVEIPGGQQTVDNVVVFLKSLDSDT